MITMQDIQTITEHYIAAMLWSGCEEYGAPLEDQGYTLTAQAEVKALANVASFVGDNWELVCEYIEKGQTLEQLGHDLWLTSEGHGAGFWDRGLGELGTKLTGASLTYQMDYYANPETLEVECT